MAKDRCIDNTLLEFEEANHNPIFSYVDSPLLTLEEAVEKIIPFVLHLMDYVATAKNKCNQHLDLLTRDESAAIYLYTMPTSFYLRLNETLRAKNRHALKPWFDFLKLFITALEKLPSTNEIVWRAVYGNVGSIFDNNDEHIWWSVNSCSIDLRSIEPYLGNNGTLFAIHASHAKDITAFSAVPDEKEVLLMPGTRLRAKCEPLSFIDRLSVIHLEEIDSQRKSQAETNYLFEQIKQQYQRNSRIERLMNPSKTFPIEQSYINLAIVKAKEQHEKEKQLRNAQHNHTIIDTFEQIYGTKTAIDVKDIFQTCKTEEKRVLVFGRAGIGKSTFSRHVAYQWAKGSLWQQYELLALIPLRRLTANRYPPNEKHSLIDLVKKEVFEYELTEKEEIFLKKHFDAKKTLWILDGYDEVVQNVPPHLEFLFEKLLKTPHHIITSRPYLNTLSHDVKMEITGFTDENILNYVKQFFNQMKDELVDALIKSQTLLNFLRSNSSIWGVVHIPVNLELICSLWSNEDRSEIEHLSMTRLYIMMIEWLCRRYLAAQNLTIQNIPKKEVYRRCQKELAFLENLAFNAMESNTIVIQPSLLEKAIHEAQVSLGDNPNILNLGILKSYNTQGIGNQTETEKDHYFLHLSFQEYFAARYLINALKGPQNEKAIQFIKHQKYNKRYALVFSFVAGLLNETDVTAVSKIFWDNLLEEPLDLIGIRQIQLVISCIEETSAKSTFPQRTQLLAGIGDVIKYQFFMKSRIISEYLLQSLQTAQSLVCEQKITDMFIDLLQRNDIETKSAVLSFISKLNISNPSNALLTTVTTTLENHNDQVRQNAWEALVKRGEKAATNEVISKLVIALGDENEYVRMNACKVFGYMGEKAATNEVISKLMSALGDEKEYVRDNACSALGKMGEKAATNEAISKLVTALGDEKKYVRMNACKVLGNMGEKAATNEVISKLVSALGDESGDVRRSACSALGKMGEKAATNEVISKLVSALGDESEYVRSDAIRVLEKMGEKAATNEAISKLVSVLGDENLDVRMNAIRVLGKMGEKTAMNEVISKLVSVLGDENLDVRMNAIRVLRNMGEKAATNEAISKLVIALGDEREYVRMNACKVLGNMGEKAATNEAISKLVIALGDESEYVRGNACEALGKMGEKAATNEVISKLVSALGDESGNVRWNACSALGKMDEKAGTIEVISKLVSALGYERKYVRMNACKVLGNMGEKAATNEVISKLVSALGDESGDVRRSACSALGKMGEKTATNEVISKLVIALGDEMEYVRMNACKVLENMGEKAATNEAISKLVSALGDESGDVRWNACSALGKMGEKAATNEAISKLVSALGDESGDVRWNACSALGKMGEKAVTNEAISKLVSALGDEKKYVRMNACEVLGNMGKKVATNEAISKLVSALGDEMEYVRGNACEALLKMGEKAATNEAISKLVSALGDESGDVRMNACKVLGNMGEKAATNEVISKLVIALGDETRYVRWSACSALEMMGEKAATNEVISKLMSALGDESGDVRMNAIRVLGNMGEKAATNEVISKLVIALGDENKDVIKNACEVLGNMGEKAATNEVISKLANIVNDQSSGSVEAVVAVRDILSSSAVIKQLDPNIIRDLGLSKYASVCFENVSEDEIIKFSFNIGNPDWLPAVANILLVKGVAVTAIDGKVVVYCSKEPIELSVPIGDFTEKLIKTFTDQQKRLHLYLNMA